MQQAKTPTLKEMIGCAMKTGVIKFVDDPETNTTVAQVGDSRFSIADCGMEGMAPNAVELRILNDLEYRELVELKAEACLDDSMVDDDETYCTIVAALEKAYIQPDDTLHLCVGFYGNGDFKANTVKGRNLADNIEYNRHMRPGRFYYVDGEYMCGGMLKKEFMPDRITQHKAWIKELGLKPKDHDTAPYE